MIADWLWDGLRVRRDLAHSLQVGILFSYFHCRLALFSALLPLTVLVLKWSSNGSRVRVLLSNLENPFSSPHGDVFIDATFNGCLVRAYRGKTDGFIFCTFSMRLTLFSHIFSLFCSMVNCMSIWVLLRYRKFCSSIYFFYQISLYFILEGEEIKLSFVFPSLILTAELREMASSATSILAVGMGLGPQKEDSINIACGEFARRWPTLSTSILISHSF